MDKFCQQKVKADKILTHPAYCLSYSVQLEISKMVLGCLEMVTLLI